MTWKNENSEEGNQENQSSRGDGHCGHYMMLIWLLYALENHFKIISDGFPDKFHHGEGYYVLEEAAEGEA